MTTELSESAPHHAAPSGFAISKSRLEFLFDGIFAIAMTILVLELKVPELADRHSADELAQALAHHTATFGSYLLSFTVLGVFWYRHNQHYRHLQHISKGMLALHLVQLATAAFFPFCAALLGRYPTNHLTVVVYAGCIMVYFWASLIYWLLAKRARAFVPQLTVADYELFRNRAVRGCLLITAVFVLNLVRLFLG